MTTAQIPQSPEHHAPHAEPASQRPPTRILIVDDDPDDLVELRQTLEAGRCEVTILDSAAAAEKAVAAQRPDVAIIDLIMDQPDAGFTLAYHFKKKYPRLPVIILSSAHSETDMDFDATTPEEKRWIKADAILEKPVRVEQLTREIERLMEGCSPCKA